MGRTAPPIASDGAMDPIKRRLRALDLVKGRGIIASDPFRLSPIQVTAIGPSPRHVHCTGLNSRSMTTQSPETSTSPMLSLQHATPAPSGPMGVATPMGISLLRR